MTFRILFFVLLLLLFTGTQAQQDSSKRLVTNIDFILHLVEIGALDEAELETQKQNIAYADTVLADSLYYMMGRAYQEKENYLSSAKNFMQVSANSSFYYPSRFLAAKNYLKLNKVDSLENILNSTYLSTNKEINQLLDFELAGISLLKNNYHSFDSLYSMLDASLFLEKERDILKRYKQEREKIQNRSAFMAGLLSSIVPGLGKVYAGNRAQGLSSFLRVGVLGIVAAENIIKKGYDAPSSILFSGIFTLFYLGNIWGSAMSVHIIKNEKKVENNYNVMVSLELPISRFFK